MDEFYHLLNDLKMKFTEMQARHLAGHFPEFSGAGTEELEVTVAFSLIRASHTHIIIILETLQFQRHVHVELTTSELRQK